MRPIWRSRSLCRYFSLTAQTFFLLFTNVRALSCEKC